MNKLKLLIFKIRTTFFWIYIPKNIFNFQFLKINAKNLFSLDIIIVTRINLFFNNMRQTNDCSNGLVTKTTDDVGNTPDSCCLARGIESYSNDYGHRDTDYSDYCIQIKKSKALDYASLLEDIFRGPYLDQIIIKCGSELVYDSEDPSFSAESSSSFLSYIRTLNLWILFIFLLF